MSRLKRLRMSLAIVIGSGFAASAQPLTAGPVFTPAQIHAGISMTAQDCARYLSTVYVKVQGTGICFRYHLSTVGGLADQAVYYLSGDKDRENQSYDPAAFDERVAGLSRLYGRPAVYLSRMGLDGSSGFHSRFRRTWLEVDATNLAINAINARHGFKLIHVMGQSGGGGLTGSLIGIRHDLGCAIPGSAPLTLGPRDIAYNRQEKTRTRLIYDPSSRLAEAARASLRTRILVATDRQDVFVSNEVQSGFVRGIQRAGGRITQYFIVASDKDRHGSTIFTRLMMAECLKGTSDPDIALLVARLSEKLANAKVAASPSSAVSTPATEPARNLRIARSPQLAP